MRPYFVYMVRCTDGSLYTGICTDLARRIAEHNSFTKGAHYTRSRQPVILAYSERLPDRSTALKREHVIKHLSREEKINLIG